MIKAEKLEFAYSGNGFQFGIPALEIKRGSKVALVGESGSGKTTLLRLLAGILVPKNGSIALGEVQISSQPDAVRRRFRIGHIGFIFQDFGLIEYLSIFENILLPYLIHSELQLTVDVKIRARDLCAEVGLQDIDKGRVETLSQGEKQRVAICRALLNSPDYLFADEPTGNLDKKNGNRVLDLLFDQAEKSGATLLVVTHDTTVLDRFDSLIQSDNFTGFPLEVCQ